jgi:hypothetical protein
VLRTTTLLDTAAVSQPAAWKLGASAGMAAGMPKPSVARRARKASASRPVNSVLTAGEVQAAGLVASANNTPSAASARSCGAVSRP